jgi:hypothetical protein
MQPEDKEIASYLFSEKVNYLAHVNVGKRQRILITSLVVGSAVLSTVATAVGLSDVSKAWVSVISIAAAAASTLVLALLPSANWRNHLRVGSDYEALYQDTLICVIAQGKVNEDRLAELRERFKDLTLEAGKVDVQLGDRQITRYVSKARRGLPESIRQAGPELLD